MLKIEKLSVGLPAGADRPFAVRNVSLTIPLGTTLCVVGESGSGKSVIGQTIAGLQPHVLRSATSGSVILNDRNLTALTEREWQTVRGCDVGMVFQEPMTALNPLMPVGKQIAEVFRSHGMSCSKAEARDRVHHLLERVGIHDPKRIANSYSFRISGGQRQRVMIAMAVAMKPKVLIADEPTTALDVTTQRQVLDLLGDLQSETGMALVFVTHDFGIVADIADDVAVMQHGELVEYGKRDEILTRPQQAYTRKLLDAVPRLDACRPIAAERQAPVVDIIGLSKRYTISDGFLRQRRIHALDDISFKICKGEVVSLVGESGSGKSTIARCLTRLQSIDGGEIRLDGVNIMSLKGDALKVARRRIQIIFQDPYGSLDPRQRVIDAVAAGPIAHGTSKKQAHAEAADLLGLVGLGRTALDRYPHEFSGGQRQRIGIARALALKPDLLIADEAVSALDVTVQAQVLDLLASLRDQLGLTMLFITHDLRVAGKVSDRIIVLKQGKIVEEDYARTMFSSPREDYTRTLLTTIPGLGTIFNDCTCDPLGNVTARH
ncbi:ABC transporter ATP-binding protein [Rhizobium sp. CG5]|uniref:dipeptide ABC transporter ATP-binding protein n=1 Tax=Rhizobium sp. CG5 TaxID=2726076 RepID=UPI002033D240|nr:ABC transporter ATP-binding protein [Rhizobium sp. CG5]MCM2477296.1 ABC transporter ATP-binding protein [Rhizobium sp. CG5]